MPEAFEWHLRYLAAVDRTDAEAYGTFLAEDSTFRFGNNPPVTGEAAILEGLRQFWATYDGKRSTSCTTSSVTIDASRSKPLTSTGAGDANAEVPIPAVAITEWNEAGLVTSFNVFIDIAPHYA